MRIHDLHESDPCAHGDHDDCLTIWADQEGPIEDVDLADDVYVCACSCHREGD